MTRSRRLALPVAFFALSTCAQDPAASTADAAGERLAVNVAALNLEGVGDVVWDLEVRNGASTPQTVWQRRVSSSGYGDGAGSASYVGTCDAGANPNTVRVWVVGVYAEAVTTLGTFASGDDSLVVGDAMPFQNPTELAPLEREIVCLENTDVVVQFDVALMRPAQQGFFDIAVNFNNIFCSAKFDCCVDADNDGCEAGEDIALLFDAAGARGRTMVLGFACTAGPDADVATVLHMDALDFDCTTPAAGFAPDFSVSPAGADAGNQCDAGDVSSCAIVDDATPGAAAERLYQVAVFRGEELLTTEGLVAHKAYWNVALGVTSTIGDCTLRTRATADNANDAADGMSAGVVAAGAVYPFVGWDVPLGACGSEPLTFTGSGPVRTRYTAASPAVATSFGYSFAPGLPPAPVCAAPCAHGACVGPNLCQCEPGYTGATCQTNVNECSPNPCLNGGTCTDGVNSFTCACAAGYTGATCDTNINECAPNPCLNGGTCTDGVNAFSCACAAGYTGTTCQTNIDDCAGNPCGAGNSCSDGVATYSCTCAAGSYGTGTTSCAPCTPVANCASGLTCTTASDSTCSTCASGYSGPTCATLTTASSCWSLRQAGQTTSGVYVIDPDGAGAGPSFSVYCEMTILGGGWTLAAKMVNGDTKYWASAKTSWTDNTTRGSTVDLGTGADAKGLAWSTVVASEFMVTDSASGSNYVATNANCLGGRTLSAYFTLALASFPNTGSSEQYASCAVTKSYTPSYFSAGSLDSNYLTIGKYDSTDTQGVISSYAASYGEADYGLGSLEDPFFGTGACQTDVGQGCADGSFTQTVYFWVR